MVISIAEDRGFLALLDAQALGGDLGSAAAYALAEEAVVAHVDAVLELRTVAAVNVTNHALALQHDRITRMQNALELIKQATAGRTSDVTILAVHDLAEAGLRVT